MFRLEVIKAAPCELPGMVFPIPTRSHTGVGARPREDGGQDPGAGDKFRVGAAHFRVLGEHLLPLVQLLPASCVNGWTIYRPSPPVLCDAEGMVEEVRARSYQRLVSNRARSSNLFDL